MISIKPEDYSYVTANYGIPYWSGTQDDHTYTKEKAIADINALFDSFLKNLQVESIQF